MLALILLAAGFGLVVASSSISERVANGSPLLRPVNPLLMNIITGVAAIAGFGAMIGGFFFMGGFGCQSCWWQ